MEDDDLDDHLKRLLDDMTAETETGHPGIIPDGIWW
jgi:hypothetical protein